MKSKKNNWVFPIIIVVAILIVSILLLIKFTSFGSFGEEKCKDTYEESIDVISKLPTQIFLYGEDLCFRDEVKYAKITNISNDTLKSDKAYTVLIINDLNGDVKVSDEELECIKEKIKDYKFYFYYCGSDLIDRLMRKEIFDNNTYREGDLCCGVVTDEGERIRHGGIYTEELKEDEAETGDGEQQGEFLLWDLAGCYKSNN